MKKTRDRIIFGILIVVIAALSILSGWALKERENYQRQLAEKNMGAWYDLYRDVHGMHAACESVEDMDRVAGGGFFTYFCREYRQVVPVIGMEETFEDYKLLVNALGDDSYREVPLTSKEKEQGFELFLAMSQDLETLTQSIYNRCYEEKYGVEIGPDWEFRKGLIDYQSDVYQEVRQEIQDFCRKYEPKLYEILHPDQYPLYKALHSGQ